MDYRKPFRVKPGHKLRLNKLDPAYTGKQGSEDNAKEEAQHHLKELARQQTLLYAEHKHSVLIVLQAMDAGGKDGTIRHVMSGVNPQGVRVHSFKVPSAGELAHDFLWRYARELPARGEIGIFNRSHYEEVLVVRVHPETLDRQRLPPEAMAKGVWRRRFREINDWERHLSGNGFKIVKLMLNLSREEQRLRFLKRLDRPDKNWKFSASDIAERQYWDGYQRAYSKMLSHTSTPWAPWYVIPADHKWFARICVSAIIAQALMDINPQYPQLSGAAKRELAAARKTLEA